MILHFSYRGGTGVKSLKVTVCAFTATGKEIRWIWCIASPSQLNYLSLEWKRTHIFIKQWLCLCPFC